MITAKQEKIEPIIILNRMDRGYIIPQNVRKINSQLYTVKSETSDKQYIVNRVNGALACECPDHTYRHVKCKHIYAVEIIKATSTHG